MDYEPSQLPEVDAVEMVELVGLRPNRVSEYMRIAFDAPYVRVKGETAQQIAHLWRQLPPSEQMRCHNPPFGLRFYMGDKLLVQGSICWGCNNIYVEENGEKSVYKFDGQHTYSQQLLALLEPFAVYYYQKMSLRQLKEVGRKRGVQPVGDVETRSSWIEALIAHQ